MMKFSSFGDCPGLNMAPRSEAHENRFEQKTKRSENMKINEKLQNSKKTKANKS